VVTTLLGVSLDSIFKLISPVLVAVAGWIWKWIVEGRPKLVVYMVNAASLPLPHDQSPPGPNGLAADAQVAGPTALHTHSIVVRNTGKKPAHNVRLGHYVTPASYQLFPPVSFSVNPTGDRAQGSGMEILLPTLVPGEQITISYLYLPTVTWNQIHSYYKCDEGMAIVKNVVPTPAQPKWFVASTLALVFVGASTIVYWGAWAIFHFLSS
jgi:hypothetical protein